MPLTASEWISGSIPLSSKSRIQRHRLAFRFQSLQTAGRATSMGTDAQSEACLGRVWELREHT